MNSKVEQPKAASTGDIVKYALAVLLVAAGVFAFYWWPESQLRWLAVIGGVAAGLGVFMATRKGADTREFLGESRFELRKVVWPTRQEAGRATLMIIIAVIVISLVLAAFDVVIQWGIKLLLGN
ncbi:preprotein translocase subunit SecE [Lysobacter sp. A6]|uniref:Protein translocase subunit SecE n=1 Tax=Noviluteimonas lactosilytica TaxID=2888523 RepID=A0ABS8JFL0_9GAMM|nr:preprotein translocase subunit SecE [Lysobacter lactosilyticus]MCC8362342.1 preprotein translocase subunit SecE [Lysobacter lactosilyticus]